MAGFATVVLTHGLPQHFAPKQLLMFITKYLNDLIAIALVVTTIASYQYYVRQLARKNPAAVLSSAAARTRRAWVEAMMSDRSNGILAVQTLRNTTMAASFLASTAVLLMVGAMTLTGQASSLQAIWHSLNIFGTVAPEVWLTKILFILLLLFYGFFNLTNSIRIYNHVGYMVSVPPSQEDGYCSPAIVAKQLNRGGDYFRTGVRVYYYLVPAVFWLFGPIYMIMATALLVFILLPRIDLTPKHKPKSARA